MKITKTVGSYFVGAGALSNLEQFIEVDSGNVFLIDHFFENGGLEQKLPLGASDQVVYVDTTHEPTTEQVDDIVSRLNKDASSVIGIGGGSTMDIAKAASNLLTNGGKAEDYQGWDLVEKPGVFKIGVPTISGTGAEASRTCVMMNQRKNLKLGMNSDHTVFDRLILDPDLTRTVPRNQFFYTGLDTYIHCIESLNGHYRHAMADTYSDASLKLCREIFIDGDMQDDVNREKMMVASFLGGSAIGNSFVGIVHPLSAGLSMVFGTHHCVANCIVMNVMDEFYPAETEEFRKMMEVQNVTLPTGLCANLSDDVFDQLYRASIVHEKPLANALGEDFKSILTYDKIRELFERM